MPAPRRPPMAKLPPFALHETPARTKHHYSYQLLFFGVFAVALLTLHLRLLNLPFYWDELGQFIPTALDLVRSGLWVAQSAVPNVHPPGVEAYLAGWYQLFGFSIAITRVAMLMLAAAGLLFTFLLAIELSRESDGAPAFLPPLLLLVSPLFFMQSMMAQLDMPAMVLTLLALLLFVKSRWLGASITCIALVLVKETSLVVPAVFGLTLLIRRDWKHALLFVPAGLALGAWLFLLHAKTGYWLGDPGFAQYNVWYALNPVRILFALLRRIYYVFFAEFRWIGTAVLAWALCRGRRFGSAAWTVTLAVSLATAALVSILGGAELERYILPVLPVFYIAVSIGLAQLPKRAALGGTLLLVAGLLANIFWNPPYPFPFENNFAMVDFVELQQVAARYAEQHLVGRTIATAWPFSAALRRPDYGYVSHKLTVFETGDFHATTVSGLPPESMDALIVYTRTWMPPHGVIQIPLVQKFLTRFYDWEPDVTVTDCAVLGLEPEARWSRGGQQITIYVRKSRGF